MNNRILDKIPIIQETRLHTFSNIGESLVAMDSQ